MTSLAGFTIVDKDIHIFCSPMQKLIQADLNGALINELKFKERSFGQMLGFHEGKYFMVKARFKNGNNKDGIKEFNYDLYIVEKEDSIIKLPYSFMTKMFVRHFSLNGKRGGMQAISVTRLNMNRFCGRYLYLAHTEEYLVKQFDLQSQKITRSFRREYPRVPYKADKDRPFKYYNDIHQILVFRNQAWILTSTFDKKKGILIDVFNEEGLYTDSFYLPLLSSKTGDEFSQLFFPIIVKKDSLYAVEHDEDWIFSVVKYAIVE
jgi:hypothetical protein